MQPTEPLQFILHAHSLVSTLIQGRLAHHIRLFTWGKCSLKPTSTRASVATAMTGVAPHQKDPERPPMPTPQTHVAHGLDHKGKV